MRKSYTKKQQIIVEQEEAKEIEEFPSPEKMPKNKDLSNSFKKMKKGRFQGHYFKPDN